MSEVEIQYISSYQRTQDQSNSAVLPAITASSESVTASWTYPDLVDDPLHLRTQTLIKSLVDDSGQYIQPYIDLSLSPHFTGNDFKVWIARAWKVPEKEVEKLRQGSGGKSWIACVHMRDRKIKLNKYTKKSEEHWKVVSITTICGDGLNDVPDPKRQKIDLQSAMDCKTVSTGFLSSDLVPLSSVKKASPDKFTPKLDVVGLLEHFITLLALDQLEVVFEVSVTAAKYFRPVFRPYEGYNAEYPRSEYVNYSNPDEILTEDNRIQVCISWSYRLALQRYQRHFVLLIDDVELQKRLIKCKVDDAPNNLNPLTSIDTVAMKEVKQRLQTMDKSTRHSFSVLAIENMKYHLEGVQCKDHIILKDDV